MRFPGKKIKTPLACVLFFLFLAFSCSGPRHESVTVDFSTSTEEGNNYIGPDSLPVLRVAIATVLSPRESYIYYKEIFDYISERLNLNIEFKQRVSFEEVMELLANNQVDIAFMCSGAYSMNSEKMDLLVVPVHDGLPYYQGYIITQKNSGINKFEDFRGKSFSYSDPLCVTGKLFVDGKLSDMGLTAEEFFGEVIYSSSHDISIQMVSRNLVDGSSVNSLIYDYLEQFQPDALQNVKMIEQSKYFGIPPIVNSPHMPAQSKKEIQDIFINMHLFEEGRNILQHLQVDQFILAGDTLYDGIREARKRLQQ